jgi:hypothetical protein
MIPFCSNLKHSFSSSLKKLVRSNENSHNESSNSRSIKVNSGQGLTSPNIYLNNFDNNHYDKRHKCSSFVDCCNREDIAENKAIYCQKNKCKSELFLHEVNISDANKSFSLNNTNNDKNKLNYSYSASFKSKLEKNSMKLNKHTKKPFIIRFIQKKFFKFKCK